MYPRRGGVSTVVNSQSNTHAETRLRMNPLTIHSQPEGLRRPVLITAFNGWNDAAEAAPTPARYLGPALLAEVPHTRPIRISGSASDPELAARLGVKPSRYEGPTGIVGVLNTACREQGLETASVWANVPHYISGIENPKAALAIVQRVLMLLNAEADLTDLDDATKQVEQNLSEIVAQNAKIKAYVAKLESRDSDEPEPATTSDLPPAAELVEEMEQFLRQQRPE